MNPRKWNIPLTYEPKIEPVRRGECTQTIRMGRKFKAGDLVRFYRWTGKPYRSKQETITGYMEIVFTNNIVIYQEGFTNQSIGNPGIQAPWIFKWEGEICEDVAKEDGIIPPTGEALRDVLVSKNGPIPAEGLEAQIIRWRP